MRDHSTSSEQAVLTVWSTLGEKHLPFTAGPRLTDILSSGGLPVRSSCGGLGTCRLCLVRLTDSARDGQQAGEPTEAERLQLTDEQLQQGYRLACQLRPVGSLTVIVENPVVLCDWRPLTADEYSAIAIEPDAIVPHPRYAAAVDVGTTHIRLTLWDRLAGTRLAGYTGLNPQAAFGADILTRLMEAIRSNRHAEEIREAAMQAIAEGLEMAVASADRSLDDIGEVRLVGNTAMLSLLSGKNFDLLLAPEHWHEKIDYAPTDAADFKTAWRLNEAASVIFEPSLGGFIGSDLSAAIVATRLTAGRDKAMLIDFGTNSEIALWDGQALHLTSTPGGPAFEGCGISCGVPGGPGAIYRVRWPDDGPLAFDIQRATQPTGLCGSGLVDAIAGLLKHGYLDKVGRLRDRRDFALTHDKTGRPIVLTARDIDTLQRAKAAIGAAIVSLCRQVGIDASEIRRLCVCGAFGRLLDVDNAKAVGLLPNVSSAIVELESNAALAGCELACLTVDDNARYRKLLQQAHIYNMADHEAYERSFVDNLYLQPITF